jgi:pyruvate formate lyase activating enzyme
VYVGNVPDHAGRNTVCPDCGRTVIDRSGPTAQLRGVEQGLCSICGADLALIRE